MQRCSNCDVGLTLGKQSGKEEEPQIPFQLSWNLSWQVGIHSEDWEPEGAVLGRNGLVLVLPLCLVITWEQPGEHGLCVSTWSILTGWQLEASCTTSIRFSKEETSGQLTARTATHTFPLSMSMLWVKDFYF